MSVIGFYHLTRQPEVRALAKLLGRTIEENHRALVLAPDAASVAALDEALWLQDDVPWLPHGTESLGQADRQPIWLMPADPGPDGQGPNAADFLFLVGGAPLADPSAFARVFDVFDSRRDGQIEAARTRYRAARAAGHAVTYWREGERGWERPA